MPKKAPAKKPAKKAAPKKPAVKATAKRSAASKYDQAGAPWWKKTL